MTRSERISLYNAITGMSDGIEDIKNQEIELASAVVAETEWANEYGELHPGHKVWLLLKDGGGRFSGSTGIAQSLFALETFLGSPPWQPPLRVILREKQSSGKNRFYYLELVDDPRPEEPTRKTRKDK